MTDELDDWLGRHGEQLRAIVSRRFGTTTFKVLAHSPVLWAGWECDYEIALVALPDGRRELVTLGATQRLTREALIERIAAYAEATAATEGILRLLDITTDD